MAYKLLCALEHTKQVRLNNLASDIAEGAPAILGNSYAFASKNAKAGENVMMITEASLVEVDCDNTLTYNAGDYVYDDDTAPSGIVNKTSGAGRRAVGYVYETKVNPSKIKIVFKGGL